MKTIIIIITAINLSGCYTGKKATRHLLKAGVSYPAITARWCSELYPPLSFQKDSIVFKKAASEIVYVYADCDSIRQLSDVRGKIKIPCPVGVHADTVFMYKEKQVVNNAAIAHLNDKLETANISNALLQQRNRALLWIIVILATYTLMRWILRFWGIRFF